MQRNEIHNVKEQANMFCFIYLVSTTELRDFLLPYQSGMVRNDFVNQKEITPH